MTTVEKIFLRYEELAIYYANKIWNEEKLSLEKEDLQQEMRIKLFLSIKAYAKRWKEYRETSSRKPVPLEFYLRTSMANLVRDFISDIYSAAEKGETSDFDKGVFCNEIVVELDDFVIGGESLTDIFPDKYDRKIAELLFEHNFSRLEVLKRVKNVKLANKTINQCLETIREYLLDNQSSEYQEFFIKEVIEE